jgi:SAM-dependent methyltransferase
VLTWAQKFADRVPAGGRVLELGCGGDNPATRLLLERYDYTGVDLSREQLERAQRAFPEATLVHADATAVEFEPESFDGVASFFMFGHIPRVEQEPLLRSVFSWLRAGGVFVTTLGTAGAEDEIDEDWLGAPMFFASFGEEENLALLDRVGFEVEEARVVPFEEPGHGLVRFMWVLGSRP